MQGNGNGLSDYGKLSVWNLENFNVSEKVLLGPRTTFLLLVLLAFVLVLIV